MKKILRLIFFFSILIQPSLFSVINVANEAQLVGAINTANGAPDTINFTAPIALTGALPAITNTYPITGGGFSLDGANLHRGFIVLNGGNPTISNLTIQNVLAQGGDGGDGGDVGRDQGGSGGGGLGAGGALFVGSGSQATLSSVTLNTCAATGGASPDPALQVNGSSGGGAGGGLGGDGGDGTFNSGGGGGGGILEGQNGNPGAGLLGGSGVGGGGNGGDRNPATNATAGTYGGGGGGAGDAVGGGNSLSAIGGFASGGGGGGDANNSRIGSNGGFGAGGGGGAANGAGPNTGGTSVFGGGNGAGGGGGVGGQGGGGAGLGGAVFVDPTSSVTITTAVNPFAATSTTGGAGAFPASALGNDIFLASGGTLDFNVTPGTVTLTNPIQADALLATGGLTKSGVGTLNLAALANTYRGTTTVSAGTLRVAGDGALGEASTTVTLAGGTLQADAPFTSPRSVAITSPSWINTTPVATTLILSGVVSGAGSLTKIGPGTLTLINALNNYAGGTDISAGTLQVGANANLGSGNLILSGGTLEATGTFATTKTVNITGASTLLVNNPNILTLDGAISSTAGSLSKDGTGMVVFGLANSYTVPTTINDGTLRLSGFGTLGNPSDLTLAAATSIFEILAGAGTKTIGVLNGVALSQIILNNNTLNIPSGSFAGVIGPGTGGINHNGALPLTLSGTNTYTGTTTISGGSTLALSGAASTLGNGSSLNITSGTFDISAGGGTKTIGALTGVGFVTLGANTLNIPSGSYGGVIQGAGGIDHNGALPLTLSGTNTYTGTTTISGGSTLALSGALSTLGNGSSLNITSGTFNISAGGGTKTIGALTGVVGTTITLGANTLNIPSGSYGGVIQGTGGINHNGALPLTLSGTNTYTGTTTVSGGSTLALSGAASTLGNASPLNITSGTFDISAGAGTKTIGALTGLAGTTITLGANTLNIPSGSFAGVIGPGTGGINHNGGATLTLSGTNTYTGTTTISGGSTLALSGAASTLGNASPLNITSGTFDISAGGGTKTIGALTGVGFVTLGANTLNIPSGSYGGVIQGTGGINHNGGATLTLSGTNTYTGTTTISGGSTLALSGAASTLGNASPLNITSGTFDISAGGGTKTIGALTGLAGTTITLGANTLNIPSGSYAGSIGGAGGINTTGPGTLTLTGVNGYLGITEVSGGTLSVSADANLGGGTSILLSGGTLQSTGTFGTAKNISITSAASNIDVTGANNLTVNGTIGGGVGLSKIGAGTLTLTNTNNYTGTTTLNGGTIALSGALSTLGNVSPLNILSGTFDISAGGGTKTIGALTGVVGTTINLGANTLNIPNGSYAGAIGPGAGGINVTGPGTLTLSGGNTYTGITEVSGGTLSVGADNNLGAGASVTLSGGILEVTGTFNTLKNISLNSAGSICVTAGNTFTVDGALSGAGGLIKNCPGTMALSSAANNYTPLTTINAGVLQLTGAGVLGATTPLNIVGGSFEILAGPKTIGTLTGAGNGINLNANNLQIPDGNFSGQITGVGGSIEKITAGALTLSSGTSNYTGGTTLTLGTLNISGPANLGTGPLIMNAGMLNPAASFTSPLPMTINGGTINTSGAIDYNLGGVVSGAGALLKTGAGILTVSGAANIYTGLTTVTAGELFLNGGVFGPVTINPGARLAGNGSVGTVNNSGTISPGASIGTITVIGNLNLSPASTLDIEIDHLGNSDLIIVTGTANLDGTLNAIPISATIDVFPKDLEYTIISAGVVNNQFATLTGTPPFQYFIRVDGADVILFLQENIVVVNLDAIEKGNPRSVAKYLASCKDPKMGLLDFLMLLEQLEGDVLNDALNQLSSARFGALSLVNFNADSTVANIFGNHLKKLYRCKTKIGACEDDAETFCFKQNNWSVWAEPFLNFSHHDKTEQQRSFHNETYGGVLGADYSFANNICLGGGAGYSYANMDWGQSLGKSLINSVYGGVYSSWFNEQGFVNLSVMGTRNFYHVGRRVHFPGYDRTAHHHHRGWDLTTHLGGGLEFPLGETFHFQPTLDIDYINVFQGEFRERNLGGIDLVVRSKQSGLLRSALALNLVNDFKTDHVCYSPGILVGWVHEAYLSSANYKANMTSKCLMDPSFIVKTFHKDQDYRLLGVSLTVIHDKGFVFTVNYHTEFNHLYTKHEGRGRFEWNF